VWTSGVPRGERSRANPAMSQIKKMAFEPRRINAPNAIGAAVQRYFVSHDFAVEVEQGVSYFYAIIYTII